MDSSLPCHPGDAQPPRPEKVWFSGSPPRWRATTSRLKNSSRMQFWTVLQLFGAWRSTQSTIATTAKGTSDSIAPSFRNSMFRPLWHAGHASATREAVTMSSAATQASARRGG